jgi:hypothetical protein
LLVDLFGEDTLKAVDVNAELADIHRCDGLAD